MKHCNKQIYFSKNKDLLLLILIGHSHELIVEYFQDLLRE